MRRLAGHGWKTMMNSGSNVPSNTWHASRTSDCSGVLLLAQRQRRASSTVAREMGEFGPGLEGTGHMEMEKERGYRLAAGRGPGRGGHGWCQGTSWSTAARWESGSKLEDGVVCYCTGGCSAARDWRIGHDDAWDRSRRWRETGKLQKVDACTEDVYTS